MSTITREWLKQKISDMEATRDEIPFGLEEEDRNTLAALRIALASLEAEPVADVVAWSHPAEERTCDIRWRRFDVAPGLLYTAPPAPVSMPKRMRSDYAWAELKIAAEDCESWSEGWNACRAAMQGAEPVTTAYKFPDGWVACSERMPSKGERDIWLFDGEFVHHGYIWNGNDFVDWNEEYESIKGITYWMKMALPAAPQQE